MVVIFYKLKTKNSNRNRTEPASGLNAQRIKRLVQLLSEPKSFGFGSGPGKMPGFKTFSQRSENRRSTEDSEEDQSNRFGCV